MRIGVAFGVRVAWYRFGIDRRELRRVYIIEGYRLGEARRHLQGNVNRTPLRGNLKAVAGHPHSKVAIATKVSR